MAPFWRTMKIPFFIESYDDALTSEQLVSANLTEASIELERVQASDDVDADLTAAQT